MFTGVGAGGSHRLWLQFPRPPDVLPNCVLRLGEHEGRSSSLEFGEVQSHTMRLQHNPFTSSPEGGRRIASPRRDPAPSTSASSRMLPHPPSSLPPTRSRPVQPLPELPVERGYVLSSDRSVP